MQEVLAAGTKFMNARDKQSQSQISNQHNTVGYFYFHHKCQDSFDHRLRENVTSTKKSWNEKVQGAVSGMAVSRGSKDALGSVSPSGSHMAWQLWAHSFELRSCSVGLCGGLYGWGMAIL